jgi:molybdopterin-binding protein
MNMDENMTIHVSTETHDLLKRYLRDGENHDQFVRRLLELAGYTKFAPAGDSMKNVFKGVAEHLTSTTAGPQLINVKINDDVAVEAISDHAGNVRVFVPPQDILVSREPILSSARNTFRGKITEIRSEGDITFVTADIGVPMLVQLTKKSADALGAAPGHEMTVTFKASSVRIY